jgi:hypothetical protein
VIPSAIYRDQSITVKGRRACRPGLRQNDGARTGGRGSPGTGATFNVWAAKASSGRPGPCCLGQLSAATSDGTATRWFWVSNWLFRQFVVRPQVLFYTSTIFGYVGMTRSRLIPTILPAIFKKKVQARAPTFVR